MRAPNAAELLGVWERSGALGPAERADALLGLGLPGEHASDLTVGERDARLLELRELLFGSALDGAAECAGCGEQVEYSLSAQTLAAERDPALPDDAFALSVFGYELRFRLPTGADLSAAASAADVDGARTTLLERCVLTSTVDGREEPAASLPAPVVTALAERLARADPLGDVRLALTCPACSSAWTVVLDVGAWLWSELESWARRTVLDVHALASAYGWSEAEILALGPRRELYVELVEQ
jgi:hypothetical protein